MFARVLVSAEWKLTDRCGNPILLYHLVYVRVIQVLMETTINRALDSGDHVMFYSDWTLQRQLTALLL